MIRERNGLLKQPLLQKTLLHRSHTLLSPSSDFREYLQVHPSSSFLGHRRLLESRPGTGSCRLDWSTTAYCCFHNLTLVSVDYLDAVTVGSWDSPTVALTTRILQGVSSWDRTCSAGSVRHFQTQIGDRSFLAAACTHRRRRRSFCCFPQYISDFLHLVVD